ncbi:hypothetical protein ISN45_Aa04g012200 [Arabidopsis thaliana x Arabidopsis arenosa]|uniref:Uncharacterized protein n=1 Tax=Arabidopsis thaliana x Arabidopsis arenosa TaxID=1240361 RepID=A0A8T2A6Y6_9BRAS|nr:hypothetical protein ISN45_Aa04g012200 [Arabidopsis thaliana x Arabidopsis arenosa]
MSLSSSGLQGPIAFSFRDLSLELLDLKRNKLDGFVPRSIRKRRRASGLALRVVATLVIILIVALVVICIMRREKKEEERAFFHSASSELRIAPTGYPNSASKLENEITLCESDDVSIKELIKRLKEVASRKIKISTSQSLNEFSTTIKDVHAIENIKSTYKVNKVWTGDPCSPRRLFPWEGTSNYQIKSLMNLSSSKLQGPIAFSFRDLSLELLDLKGNNLDGCSHISDHSHCRLGCDMHHAKGKKKNGKSFAGGASFFHSASSELRIAPTGYPNSASKLENEITLCESDDVSIKELIKRLKEGTLSKSGGQEGCCCKGPKSWR